MVLDSLRDDVGQGSGARTQNEAERQAQSRVVVALSGRWAHGALFTKDLPIEFVESVSREVRKQLIALHPDQTTPPGDILIARQEEMPVKLVTHALSEIGVNIPSSHWVRDYAPTFGIGKFLTVNIPQPEQLAIADGELSKRVNGAVDALKRMELDIQKGEYTQCAEDSRPLLELLNNPDLIRPLLKTSGLPDANAESLLSGLGQVYAYANAFHHRTERDGKVVSGAVNASSEDAYLAFATAAALLNLVQRKLSRKPLS